MARLDGRVALVTGGSRGIGAGIATKLAREGAGVAFCYLEGEDDAATTAASIGAYGRPALAMRADLRDPEACGHVVEQTVREMGRLDILVNNAGIARWAPFLDFSLTDWTDVLDTNLRAAFLCSQWAGIHMAARGSGRIIHISSTFSQVAVPEVTAYCVSKAGLAMLAKTMAVELGPLGITVNCVGPSTIRTPLNAHLLDRGNMQAREAALNPRRRIGRPEDIAAMVAFLASDEADWVNGQNIIVDGGLTAMSPQPAYDPGTEEQQQPAAEELQRRRSKRTKK